MGFWGYWQDSYGSGWHPKVGSVNVVMNLLQGNLKVESAGLLQNIGVYLSDSTASYPSPPPSIQGTVRLFCGLCNNMLVQGKLILLYTFNLFLLEVQCKVIPVLSITQWRQYGRGEVLLHVFLTLGEWSASCCVCFACEEWTLSWYWIIGPSCPQGQSGCCLERRSLCLCHKPNTDPFIMQPVATIHCTGWAVPKLCWRAKEET
jgi:hypothetical protein